MEHFFDDRGYIAYPATVVDLANQLKIIIDDYLNREINNEDLKNCIYFYAENVASKFFNGTDYNTSVKRLVGSRRLGIIDDVLRGYQNRL